MKKKHTLIYYRILNYLPENMDLLRRNFRVVTLQDPGCDTEQVLRQADVIIEPLGYFIGKEKIDKAPRLKVIASNTTGHPHIDVGYAKKKGVKVITLKSYPAFLRTITPTAEHAWGLIIALTRNYFPVVRSVMSGMWDRKPFGGRAMLSRMTIGIAGFGRLGQRVGSYAKCFGMKVRYYDPYVNKAIKGIERVRSLEKLVGDADIVTVHIPHEKETEGMFGRRIFSRFKKGSYFINTSRGELVDFGALLDALRKKQLAGAAMDVFEGEYQPGFQKKLRRHRLWKYAKLHGNLLLTPHIGGSTHDAWRLTQEFTIKEVMAYLRNRK